MEGMEGIVHSVVLFRTVTLGQTVILGSGHTEG